MANFVKAGLAPKLLEDGVKPKSILKALVKVCEAALMRSYLVLEPLGYSPENPPPDTRVPKTASVN